MKKKTVKNIEKTYKASEVLIMLESINDNVAIIAEQQLGTNNRLDGIDNRLDGIDDRLDGIDNRLDGIDDRLDGIDNRLDSMHADINVMKSDISDIKYDLKQKVSYEEFEKMEKRVIKLEKLVFAKL